MYRINLFFLKLTLYAIWVRILKLQLNSGIRKAAFRDCLIKIPKHPENIHNEGGGRRRRW